MRPQNPDKLREVILSPYRRDLPLPRFRLRTWDANRTGFGGKSILRYELAQLEPGRPARVLFAGEDFGCSPCYAIDSDQTLAGLLGFLTLRPGDTDAEYFADYTVEQRAFCDEHAEALSCEAINRFGED